MTCRCQSVDDLVDIVCVPSSQNRQLIGLKQLGLHPGSHEVWVVGDSRSRFAPKLLTLENGEPQIKKRDSRAAPRLLRYIEIQKQ